MAFSRRPHSLSVRLFALAAAWSLIALAVAGMILLERYRQATEQGFETLVNLHLQNVIASVSPGEDGGFAGLPELGDPRFSALHSGWYWQVLRRDDASVRITSPSLARGLLALPASSDIPFDHDFRRSMVIEGPNGARLQAVEQLVLVGDGVLSYAVAADLGVPEGDVAGFRNQLILVFSILGAGLVVITVLQVRLGLRPLRDLGRALVAIREGRTARLEGDYPDEISPLARELNALLDANAQVVERSRMHVGNLAHGLKTPLAVLKNEAGASSGPLARKVIEQVAAMRHQIDHYLDRARLAARAGVIGVVCDVPPVVEGLRRAMVRIHSERGLAIDTRVPETLTFQGERQDLEEMVGNLMDNACKWARSRVTVECVREADNAAGIVIVIEDDGPGLSEEQAAEALRRGIRLDETKPGTGLGLSIVGELAEVYGGGFTLERSAMGGLRAVLRLPAA